MLGYPTTPPPPSLGTPAADRQTHLPPPFVPPPPDPQKFPDTVGCQYSTRPPPLTTPEALCFGAFSPCCEVFEVAALHAVPDVQGCWVCALARLGCHVLWERRQEAVALHCIVGVFTCTRKIHFV